MNAPPCVRCAGPTGWAGVGRPRSYCPDCRAVVKAERLASPEFRSKAAERQRAYAKTEKGRDVQRRATRKWLEKPENKAKMVRYVIKYHRTEKGRERHLAIQQRYYQTEKGKAAQASGVERYRRTEKGKATRARVVHSRRAAMGADYVTARDLSAITSKPCHACGSVDRLELDHLIPLARGGRHTVGNLVSLCRRCNRSKGKLTWMEWRMSRRPGVPSNLLAA